MIRLPGFRCALGASGSSWPRIAPEDMRFLIQFGREMHRRGYPCPPPVGLSNPKGYYIRLAYLCAAEGSKGERVGRALREHHRQRRAA